MRAFRQSTGQTITAYAEAARLRHATRLLSDTDLPLGDIARQLGFAAPSAFSRWFRQHRGLSPREWRARVLGGTS